MALDGNVPVLNFLNGPREGETLPISSSDNIIVGRSPEAGLVLEEDSVSRKHARIYRDRGCLWLRDLGSRNGSRVNGAQVQRYRLEVGDRIAIGASLIRVESLPPDEAARLFNRGAPVSKAMSGRLEDIPLADVLQWLSTSRKSGVLTVTGPRVGKLHLDTGHVTSAWLEGTIVHSPEKAMLRMMRWDQGEFELDSSEVGALNLPGESGQIKASLEHLLMESARQSDELAHLASTETLPKNKVSVVFPPTTSWSELPPELMELVQTVVEAQHAGSTWQDIACGHKADDFTLTKQMVDLRRRGVVEFDVDVAVADRPPLSSLGQLQTSTGDSGDSEA